MNSLNAVQQNVSKRFPRYVAGGMDPNDFERILPLVDSWDRWLDLLRQFGDERVQLAEQATREGHRLTAAEAFVQAALYYHFGQLAYFENDVRKQQMRNLSVKTFQRGSGWIDPPVKRLEISYEGVRLVGHLRVPKGFAKPGGVFLLPGVDSTKEEMHTFEKYFLDRGVATLAFEGPGQGETVDVLAMTEDYERALSVTIDFLEKEVHEIDATRLAVYGRSMGGHLAPRAAAFEPRIKAVISAGGIYDLSYWDKLPTGVKHNFRYAWRLKTLEEAARRARRVSLEGIVEKIQCPFLVLHSGQDATFPPEGARRMAKEARCPTQLVIYEEGTHVCDNITYKYRPLVADWTADQLSRVR
jgi:alpha-beta hydrolase superfamily lysophospholipase